MKITFKAEIPILRFRDLHAGDCFFFFDSGVLDKNTLYIKTDEDDCVRLKDGVFFRHRGELCGYSPVQKVDAEIVIKQEKGE